MNTQNTAVASAQDYTDGEVLGETSLEVTRQPAALAHRTELTPESLRAEIERQQQLRAIMTEYVRSAMVEGHHYYSFNKLGKGESNATIKADKPALTQDGAYLICGLFKVTPGQPKVDLNHEDGGHFTVVAEVPFYNLEGAVIATGNGSCSTRESKYAYRWVYERDVPADVDKSQLVTRSGRDWKQYRLPNTDIADLENTVLKMAIKRATVGGVRKLPLVSELFATDPHGGNDRDDTPAAKAKTSPAKTQSRKEEAKTAEKTSVDVAEEKRAAKVQQVQQLCTWLNEHKDSIEWKSSVLASYINTMFDVDDGLRSLDFESLDKLIADLNGRLEILSKDEQSAVGDKQ